MNKLRDDSWEVSLQMRASLWAEAARPEGTWVTVVGDSMMPTVGPGTRVHLRARPLRLGHVVAFVTADGKRAVLHRVLLCIPCVPFILQAGDCHRWHGDVGIVHRRQVIGVADLPRRPPSPHQCWAVARALVTAAARRVRHAAVRAADAARAHASR